jgi:hypothetical protein
MVLGYRHGAFEAVLDDLCDVGADALSPSGSPVDTEPVVEPAEVEPAEDPDADIVRWFSEQKAEAERSRAANPIALDDDEIEGEQVLRRPGATRSWHGGGSMYRR